MNIGVFCASSDKLDKLYVESASLLGESIGKRSWSLVYGGTNCGLMREVASATLKNGGQVKGIIPECIFQRGVAADYLTELVVTPDMKERKKLIRDSAEAFIALPGGWGTLEEITEVITLKQLGMHDKPIIFFNINEFYTPFFSFIEEVGKKGFISSVYKEMYAVIDDISGIFQYLENYERKEYASKY